MVLCDTNIFIELYKGNPDIHKELKKIGQENLCVSHVTVNELLFGARNKNELKAIQSDINSLKAIPIDTAISNMSVQLISDFAMSHRLNLPDALIASTSILQSIPLFTLNVKDFRYLNVDLYRMSN